MALLQKFKAISDFKIFRYVSEIFRAHMTAYGAVVFLPSFWPGLLIFLLTLNYPNVAFSGILAVAFLFLFASVVRLPVSTVTRPCMIYNTMLVGMSVGALYKLDAAVVFFIAAASILTFVVTLFLEHFIVPAGSPVLSLPFALVSTIVYLGSWKFGNLFTIYYYDFSIFKGLEAQLPLFISSFLKAVGTLIFMPNVVSGFIIVLLMFLHSRLMLFWGVVAFGTGILIHSSLLGSVDLALCNPYSFNYLLVGLALGGTFLVSSLRTGFVLIAGVSVSVLLVGGSSRIAELYRIPVFTLPFNGTIILFLIAMKYAGLREAFFSPRKNPEETLSFFQDYSSRFTIGIPSVIIPLAGTVDIMQSFDGELTHKGRWRHALDFYIKKHGSTYSASPGQVNSYYIFGNPVLAPISGYVVSLRNDLPDNTIGMIDHINNWGNHVIIRSLDGFYVELSHFMQSSITLVPGQWIDQGAIIGKVGNSGYSFEPHLHLQVQSTGYLGDETREFNIACYKKAVINNSRKKMIKEEHNVLKSSEACCFYSRPLKGEKITALNPDYEMTARLAFVLGTVMPFTYKKLKMISSGTEGIDQNLEENCKNVIEERDFNVRVHRTQDTLGLFYFEDDTKSRLYFALRNSVFYYYDYIGIKDSPLRIFMAAMPRFPITAESSAVWTDSLSLHVFCHGLRKAIAQFFAGLSVPVKITGTWRYDSKEGCVTGSVKGAGKKVDTMVKFDRSSGFSKLRFGNEIICKRKIKI